MSHVGVMISVSTPTVRPAFVADLLDKSPAHRAPIA
jgi:hypothetical protein